MRQSEKFANPSQNFRFVTSPRAVCGLHQFKIPRAGGNHILSESPSECLVTPPRNVATAGAGDGKVVTREEVKLIRRV